MHIMHMAFFQARAGDPHELALAAHLRNRAISSVAHGSAQTADQLMHHAAQRASVATCACSRASSRWALTILLLMRVRLSGLRYSTKTLPLR